MHGVGCTTVALGKLTELIVRLRAGNIALYGDFEVYACFRVGFSFASQLRQMQQLVDGAARSDFLSLKDLLAEKTNSLGIERLLEKIHRSEFHGLDRSAHGPVSGQHDHRHLGSETA